MISPDPNIPNWIHHPALSGIMQKIQNQETLGQADYAAMGRHIILGESPFPQFLTKFVLNSSLGQNITINRTVSYLRTHPNLEQAIQNQHAASTVTPSSTEAISSSPSPSELAADCLALIDSTGTACFADNRNEAVVSDFIQHLSDKDTLATCYQQDPTLFRLLKLLILTKGEHSPNHSRLMQICNAIKGAESEYFHNIRFPSTIYHTVTQATKNTEGDNIVTAFDVRKDSYIIYYSKLLQNTGETPGKLHEEIYSHFRSGNQCRKFLSRFYHRAPKRSAIVE